jgi:hypothetical protein
MAAKRDQREVDGEAVKSSARKWQSYYCVHMWIYLYVLPVLWLDTVGCRFWFYGVKVKVTP